MVLRELQRASFARCAVPSQCLARETFCLVKQSNAWLASCQLPVSSENFLLLARRSDAPDPLGYADIISWVVRGKDGIAKGRPWPQCRWKWELAGFSKSVDSQQC